MLENTHITHPTRSGAQALAEATANCWQAILDREAIGFGVNRAHPAEFFYDNLMMGVPLRV